MNTEMNYPWHVYKKHLVALSCVTALAAFSLVARPAFAEEVKASDTNAKTEVVAPAIENVVATVETKTLDENPTATTTDAPTGTSIINSEATSVTTDTTAIPETAKPSSEASSTVISETNSTRSEIPTSKTGATVSETASMENARYEDISENRLKTDVSSFNNDENTEIQDEDPEENITGGQWYSDVQGSWHYKKDGKDLIGAHVVDNQHVYFHEDGKQAKGESVQRNNHYYFYDQNLGHRITEQFVKVADFPHDEYRYFGKYGVAVTGWQDINGNRYYFYPDTAYRVSIPWYQGDWDDFHKVYIDSKPYYFGHDGELWRNHYVRSLGGIPGGYKSMDFGTFYLGDDGQYVTGWQKKGEKEYYYFEYGRQARGIGFNNNDSQTNVMGQFIRFPEGIRYFEPYTGELVKNRMINNDKNMLFEYSHGYIPGWLYFDKDGIAVTGLQQVWGEYYYFRDAAGLPIRVQGEIVDYKGHKLYFDPNNGQMWRNRNANIDGKNYHIDENGYLTEI